MAKVIAKVIGGQPKEMDAESVADLKAQLSLTNYTASVNGSTVEDGYELTDYEFVSLSPSVKGGC